MKFENVRGNKKVTATKKQIKEAFYLLLDEVLPQIQCSLINKRGNYMCDCCDDCTYNQLLFRVKNGERSKKFIRKHPPL